MAAETCDEIQRSNAVRGLAIKDGRYVLRRLLGEGGFGATWAAYDHERREEVAVKRLELRRAADWKSFELFEREVTVLQGVTCEQVPDYIDYFQDEEGVYCLVQQLVPGDTLEHWVRQRGWRPDESDLIAWLEQVLRALDVLHSHRPGIIHRDLKPQNILRTSSGDIFIVDFGSVKSSTLTNEERRVGGSTMVGTFGYMAPEQLRGSASASTDLYALGMTTLFVMLHREPETLPTRRLKIDLAELFGPHWSQRALLRWLDRIIEPAEEDRFVSASDALRALLDGASVQEPEERSADPPGADQAVPEDNKKEGYLARVSEDSEAFKESVGTRKSGCGVVGLLALVACIVATIFGVGMPFMWVVAGVALVLVVAVGLGPDKVFAHPVSHKLSLRNDVIAFSSGVIYFVVLTIVLAYKDEASYATVVTSDVLAYLCVLMVGLYGSSLRSITRHIDLEAMLGFELPLISCTENERDLRLTATISDDKIMLREARTFSLDTWLLITLMSMALVVGLRYTSLEGLLTAHICILGLAGSIAAWCMLAGNRAFCRVSRRERVLRGRGHKGKIHTLSFDQIDGYTVTEEMREDARIVVVYAQARHISEAEPGTFQSVEVFSVHERSPALAAALIVTLQRVLDDAFAAETDDQVVLDFADAERAHTVEQKIHVAREL